MATKQKKQQRNPANIKQGANHTFRVEDAVVNSGIQVRPRWGWSEQELALLIPLAINGDQTALTTIMTAYAGIVDWKLVGTLGRESSGADIEDLALRVFLKMTRGLSRLQSVKCFIPWLMKITKNVAYSYLRALVRYRTLGKLPKRDAEVAIDHQLSHDDKDKCFQVCQQRHAHQYDAVIQRIDRERAKERAACQYSATLDHPLLLQIFKSLPPRYRDVLWDAAVNDLSHDEIAQEHDWTSSTVSRQKLCQARARIDKLPLPVVTVEIDEEGRTRAFNWNRTPLDPGSPFASL
jgi:RNA polymerase sigma factor (sigma-70 family)